MSSYVMGAIIGCFFLYLLPTKMLIDAVWAQDAWGIARAVTTFLTVKAVLTTLAHINMVYRMDKK